MTKQKMLGLLLSLATAGCSDAVLSPGVSSFSEAAEASIVPGGLETISATLTITNTSSLAQTLSWGVDCLGSGALDIRAYRSVGSTSVLAWDSAKLPRSVGCPTQLVQRTLNPGDAVILHQNIPASAILGDSLAAGPFALTIQAVTTPAIAQEVAASTLLIINAVVDPPAGSLGP